MENTIKKSLVIIGYTEILLIALFVNSKIIKVKKFYLSHNDDEDQFFKIISSFISNKFLYNYIYYSCGPGGFTIIRRIISFVKAKNFTSFHETKFLGLNHLLIIALYLNHNYKINDQGHILSILSNSSDYLVQIFQKKKNSNFILESFSNIKNINPEKIESYLETFNLSSQEINLVFLGSNKNCYPSIKNIIFVNEENILEIIFQISLLVENDNLFLKNYKNIFEENFKPLYGKLPSTNKNA